MESTENNKKLLTKSNKDLYIANSRGVELQDLLHYHLEENTLFEDNGLKKHNKAGILQEIENWRKMSVEFT